MADTGSTQTEPPSLNIKIYTQQPPPDDTLAFTAIPASTTVGELIDKIKDTVTSHPPAERQRLIFRGRALFAHDVTLLSVLGQEAAQQPDATHVFHLVISAAPTTSSIPWLNNGVPQPGPTPTQPNNAQHPPNGLAPRVYAQPGPPPNWMGFQMNFGHPQHIHHPPLGGMPGTVHAVPRGGQPGNRLFPHPPHLQHGPPPFPGAFAVPPQLFAGPNPAFHHHHVPVGVPLQPTQDHGSQNLNEHMEAVRRHFQQVLADTPPGPMRDAVQQQLAVVDEQTRQVQSHLSNAENVQSPANPQTTAQQEPSDPPGESSSAPNLENPSGQSTRQQPEVAESTSEASRRATNEAPGVLAPLPEPDQMQGSQQPIHVPAAHGNANAPHSGLEAQAEANTNGIQLQLGVLPPGITAGIGPFAPNHVHHSGGAGHNTDNMLSSLTRTVENFIAHVMQVTNQAGMLNISGALAIALMGDGHRCMTILESTLASALCEHTPAGQYWREYVVRSAPVQMRVIIQNINALQSAINRRLSDLATARASGWTDDQIAVIQYYHVELQRISWRTTNMLTRWRGGEANTANIPPSGNSTATNTTTNNSTDAALHLPTLNAPQNQSPQPPQNPSDVTAYLVNTPTGPYAIVYNQQGTFASIPLQPIQSVLAPVQPPGNAPQEAFGPAPQARGQGWTFRVGQGREQQQGQQRQQPRPGQPAQDDLFGPLHPFFRAAWLLIRILGFVWIFTSGTFTPHTLLILAGCCVFWALQAGIFGNHPQRLRRYWEGLLGLEGDADAQPQDQQRREQGRQPPGGAVPGQPNNAQAPTATQRLEQGNLTPQQAADRILHERQEQNRGWLRERFRGVERAIALFLASLYPGVGERHVRLRERMRREAEERSRRQAAAEAQETGQQQQQQPAGATSAEGSAAEPASTQDGSATAASGGRNENKAMPTAVVTSTGAAGAGPGEGSASSSAVALNGEQGGSSGQIARRREGEAREENL